MNVPFLDLHAGYVELKTQIDEAIGRSLNSGYYIGGPEVEQFEAEFAEFVEARHCVAVGNGLDALTLALRSAGVGPDDEVVVPSHTFIATWLDVSTLGAKIVPVEPDTETMNLDPDKLETAITHRTKAIVPVHLYGQPAPIEAILKIAKRYKIPVIEDGAQAHGATSHGKKIGAHGHAVTWSFYPGKNLGAFGDGGAITTNDRQLAEELRELRNYGSLKKYEHRIQGVNSRLDPIQASILQVKLAHLNQWNDRRANIAKRYLSDLSGLPLKLPAVRPACEPVWHLFVVRHGDRDGFSKRLQNFGIQTLTHYPIPCHQQGAYSADDWPAFALAEQLSREVLSLPIGPHMTEPEVDAVVDAVRKSA